MEDDQAIMDNDSPIAANENEIPWDTWHSLHPGSLKLDRLIGTLVVVVSVLVVLLIGIIVGFINGLTSIEFISTVVVASLFLLVVSWASWIFPGWSFRAASWQLNSAGLEIRRGVWWRHRIVVPHSRIQHSDIEQGPMQRAHSVATLIIHTAGTKDSSVQLDGIGFDTAEQLREALVAGRLR